MNAEKVARSTTDQETRHKIFLLSDEPTNEDQFGTHSQLAQVIADLIKSEEGGKAIAIEGGWGSGKSSVVKMLKTELEGEHPENATTRVHVFDAWSHEGDPLRRAFLETLTRICINKFDNKQEEKWQEREAREITGRHRITEQEVKPVLRSKWSILMVIIAVLYPISLVTAGGLFRNNVYNNPELIGFILIPLIIAMVPVVLLSCLLFRCRNDSKERLKEAGQFISIWNKKIDEDTVTSVHETAGPTSIEFQRYFSDLLKEYLAESERRIVIVLDNLDRVAIETAQSLWSTLRLFADCCERATHTWGHKVWFVVPYDPGAARQIWDDKNKSDTETNSQDERKPSDVSENKTSHPKRPRLSAAFLDKTFQIRFDVPPLLVADWQGHLIDLLKQAFGGDVPDVVAHRIYLLSRTLSERKRRPPTPRHLKLYVNDIGALKRRFREFPLDHLAIYAILRREGHDIRLWLYEDRPEEASFKAIFGDDDAFKDTLCAVAHGTTDIEKARVLLLHEPIISAFKRGEATEMKKLSSLHGFWQEVEDICRNKADDFGTNETEVANVFKVVHETNLLDAKVSEVEALTGFLRKLILNVEWKSLSKDTGSSATLACRMLNDPSLTKKVVARLASLSTSDEGKESDESNIHNVTVANWIEGMEELIQGLFETNHGEVLYDAVQLPDTKETVELLSEIWKAPKRDNIFMMIQFSGTVKQLLKEIVPRQDSEWTAQSREAALTLCYTRSVKVNWTQLLNGICARLSIDGELDQSEVSRLVSVAHSLKSERLLPNNVKPIKDLAKSPVIFRRIKNCESSLESEEVARLLGWVLQYGNITKETSKLETAKQGFQLAKSMLENPKNHEKIIRVLVQDCVKGDRDEFLDALLEKKVATAKLAAVVLSSLLDSKQLGEVVTPKLFIGQFANLKLIVNDEMKEDINVMCQTLIEQDQFAKALDLLSVEEGSLSGHICLVSNGGMRLDSEYPNHIKNFLSNRTTQEWIDSLREANEAYSLLAAVHKVQPEFRLGDHFAEAFEAHLSGFLDSSETIEEPPTDWNEICAALSDSWKATIASRLISKADNSERNLTAIIPLFAGPLLVAAKEHESDSFTRNGMLLLLRSKRRDAFEWAAEVAEANPRFWGATSDNDRQSFEDTLNETLHKVDRDLQLLLERIADQFSLSIVRIHLESDVEDINEEDPKSS